MQNPEIQNLANSFRSFMGGNASSETAHSAPEETQRASEETQQESQPESQSESHSEGSQNGLEGLLNNPFLQQA